jgi:cytochrome c oxidase assembly protein subunit 15
MRALAFASLLLVILLVSLSAYLRLAHSGIGCADWPACYGRIGAPPEVELPMTGADAYRKLVDESGRAMSWATPTHRLVASVLGLLVAAMAFLALKQRRNRLLCFGLLALTVYLAVLGIRSGSLHDPYVVMGNLAGGFAMLGLLGWLYFKMGSRGYLPRRVAVFAGLAVLALCLQILLGGFTSANFAATSCQTLPDCHGGWWPGAALTAALDLSREHQVTSAGQAVGGEERLAIHRAHRLGAIATLAVTLLAAVLAFFGNVRFRPAALLIFLLVIAEFGVGLASVVTGIPIVLAVAHNFIAGLLLLALLKLLALSTSTVRTE